MITLRKLLAQPRHHTETLTPATPKGRRRIRRTLGLKVGAPVTESDGDRARIVAKERETHHEKHA